jgi:hypothetical protein
MDFAGFPEFMAKFQRACMPINNNGNGWSQMIILTQAIFDSRIKTFQIINHPSNRVTLYGKRPLPVCKIAQQRWNPNDWQMIILLAY